MIPGGRGLPTLEKILDEEECPYCGGRGFDPGDAVPTPGGWEAVPAICRHCGGVIEKRRFSSR
jgi:hypothetical protein